ncbi:MAG: hypothetical protein JRM80_13845 [Nitrososphaerota archaeon]|nr:hypothetical protein [Nitrososphaerota archaeon]
MVPALLALTLFAGGPVARASNIPPLYLSINGAILDSGNQGYTQSGGEVVYATVNGVAVSVPPSAWTLTVSATVTGSTVTGTSSFHLAGTGPSPESIDVSASVAISSMIPAECFDGTGPVLDCFTQPYTSAIPGFFVGQATVSGLSSPGVTSIIPIYLESAFLNPFGSPIVITDSLTGTPSLLIVATYTQADVHWSGVTTGGTLSNTPGESTISGQFLMVTTADENLAGGTETESGTMTFLNVTPSSLDASGPYQGSSTIPTTGTVDCSSLTGIPGTCTETGFSSAGTFDIGDIQFVGSYAIGWIVPAVAFSGTATITNFIGGYPAGVPEFGSMAIAASFGVLALAILKKSAKGRPGK